MRVYQLDEAYGLTKDQVKAALELAGLPTHHSSTLNKQELAQFEAALELGGDEPDGQFREEETPVVDSAEEAVEAEVKAAIADFDSALAGELSPMSGEWEADSFPDSAGRLSDEEIDSLRPEEVGVVVGPISEHTPESDMFPVVDDRGAFVENCLLPPDLAAKVAPILRGNRINDYTLNLDRGEFVFVVWETAQKHRVMIDG